jgi:hypothetical protein
MRTTFLADESAQWALWLAASYVLSPVTNIFLAGRRRRANPKHAR